MLFLIKLLCDEYFALSFATLSTPKTQTKEGTPKRSGVHRDYIKKVTPHCGKVHMWRTPFRYESTEDNQVLKGKLSFATGPLRMWKLLFLKQRYEKNTLSSTGMSFVATL